MSENKQLNVDQLEEIIGGSSKPSEAVAYLMLLMAASIENNYKSWLAGATSASWQQKYEKIKVIAQKVYNDLDEVCKQALDEFLTENPFDWETMLKNIVNNN